jgi:hypothetical protein
LPQESGKVFYHAGATRKKTSAANPSRRSGNNCRHGGNFPARPESNAACFSAGKPAGISFLAGRVELKGEAAEARIAAVSEAWARFGLTNGSGWGLLLLDANAPVIYDGMFIA